MRRTSGRDTGVEKVSSDPHVSYEYISFEAGKYADRVFTRSQLAVSTKHHDVKHHAGAFASGFPVSSVQDGGRC
jgi:hypothetical protein